MVKQNQQVYTLKLSSVGWSNNTRTRISRGYKKKKYSDIVKEIFDDKLTIGTIHDTDYTSQKTLDIEETQGTYDVVIPRWKPFRCFDWLASRAKKNNACNFVFFESLQNFHFRSIESLLQDEAQFTYSINPVSGQKTEVEVSLPPCPTLGRNSLAPASTRKPPRR